MKTTFFYLSLLVTAILTISCAGSAGGVESESSSMGDSPCEECGAQGDIELKISDEKFYREWNQVAFSRLDSSAVVGVFPTLKVTAKRPKKCKFCHSFSEEALDFDLARVEDSIFGAAFPKMQRELMLPGMRLPDEDSLYIDSVATEFLNSVFADGKKLSDYSPWIERDSIEQAYAREVPQALKSLMETISRRYALRYISIPVAMDVEMVPDLGKSGGYTWKILWTLWDSRYGELVFLTYSEWTAATTSRVAPEKEWATPFAPRLSKMFHVDFSKLESH